MKEPYREAVAKHPDPESCADPRERMGEALTGEHAGRVLISEIISPHDARNVTDTFRFSLNERMTNETNLGHNSVGGHHQPQGGRPKTNETNSFASRSTAC